MSYVLLDVDGVVVDYHQQARPGTFDLMRGFMALGFDLVLWSAGYEGYPREIAVKFQIPVLSTHKKPDYPIDAHDALDLLGYAPVLQLDDDPTERVADWPFVLITCDVGEPAGFRRH